MTDSRMPPSWTLVLRSLVFSIGFVSSVLVYAIPSVLTFPLPYRWRYAFVSQWCHFNIWWLRVTCRIDYVVEGAEHIPSQPSIVLSKHQSTWETLALQQVFPPQVWVLKRELLWVPFFGWGLAVLDPIAINRRAGRQAVKQLLEQGAQRLSSGRWVVVFPEGTRIPPGQKGQYRLGGGRLAAQTGVPVVPVAHNAGEFWPRRGFLKFPGTIRVVVGPVIRSEGRTPEEITADAEAWIEATMGRITTKRR